MFGRRILLLKSGVIIIESIAPGSNKDQYKKNRGINFKE